MRLLSAKGISKRYGSLWANRNIGLELDEGEIVSLLGENGAGKTTLMNILYGLYRPDSGTIRIRGKETVVSDPREAISLGIFMVHQHFMLVDSLSVVDNVIIGNEPRRNLLIDYKESRRRVSELVNQYKLEIPIDAKVGSLSVGEKQKTELIKALYNECDILILDEPTAVLTPSEVDAFFAILRNLKASGKGIILISHKLREVMSISDRIYIMRKGEIVAETSPGETDVAKLSELMVGHPMDTFLERKKLPRSKTALRIRDLVVSGGGRKDAVSHLDLDVENGTILGIAAVAGNGQSELIEAIMGLAKLKCGSIVFHDKEISTLDVKERFRLGIGYIPEDRQKDCLVGQFSLKENLILGYQDDPRFANKSVIDWKKVGNYSESLISEYGVRCEGANEKAAALSGGNQQKLVIGRVVGSDPDLIIAGQPTRGVDIGALQYIHNRLIEMRNKGKAIILVSADLDEVLKLSDRVVVMFDGKIVLDAENGRYSKSQIGAYMIGAGAGCGDGN